MTVKGLKWISALTSVFGIIFIIYGWTQSWDFSAHTTEFETMLLIRTVRTYVFIIGGLVLLVVSISLRFIHAHLRSLESKPFELEIKRK